MNRKKSIFLLFGVVGISLFSVISATVTWFKVTNEIKINTGAGSLHAQYFKSGDGSEENPYVIATKTHLYNLSWLQYLGWFNRKGEDGNYIPTYFELDNELSGPLDMEGMAIPPIGTSEYPFIGVFNGNDKTVKNLTVSNNINEMSEHPNTVSTINNCAIVGFFGVVGDPASTGIVESNVFDFSSLSEVKSIHNFYLEDISIKSYASKTLMGVVAGFVNGIMNDIGVKDAVLSIGDNVDSLDGYESVISRFSLIGDTTNDDWLNAYQGSSGGGGQGQQIGFGGSINMWDTNRRVTYILNKDFDSSNANAGYHTKNSGNSTYGAYFYMSGVGNVLCVTSAGAVGLNGGTPTNAGTVYLRAGTLPINVDTKTMFEGTETISTTTKSGNKWVVASSTYYQEHSSEIINDENTGYFVGEKAYGTSSTSQAVVFGSKNKTIFRNSYSSVGGDIKIYSVAPSDSTFYVIKDEDNQSASVQSTAKDPSYFGYTNYENVITNCKSTLDNAISTGYINGFRLTATSSLPTTSTAFDVNNVKINKTTNSSYKMIARGLNFTVAQKGSITLLLTGYDSVSKYSYARSSFRLYSVNRSSPTTISSINEITKVYQNTDDKTVVFNTNPGGNYRLAYDASKWSGTLGDGCLYYCEIPVNPGDYFIGSPSTVTNYSGYLVYLDIGDNSGPGGGGSTGTYDLKNVRYVHVIPQTTPDGETYLDILFKIATAGATSSTKVYFKRTSGTTMQYYLTTSTISATPFVLGVEEVTGVTADIGAVWDS